MANKKSKLLSKYFYSVAVLILFLVLSITNWLSYDHDVARDNESYYLQISKDIISHGWLNYFSPPEAVRGNNYPYKWINPIYREPLYPLILAIADEFSETPLLVIRLLQTLLSFLTLILGISILRLVSPSDDRPQYVFVGLSLLSLDFLGFTLRFNTETLDAFFLMLQLWLVLNIKNKPQAKYYIYLGIVMALNVLLKSYWFYFSLAIIAFIFWRDFYKRGDLRPVMLVLIFVVLLLPTLTRNYRYTNGHFVFATKNAYNLWKDNNSFTVENHDWREKSAEKNAWFEGLWEARPGDPVRPPCNKVLGELLSCERKNAFNFLLNDPIRFIKRAVAKNVNLWSPNSFIFNGKSNRYKFDSGHFSKLLQKFVNLFFIFSMLLFIVGIFTPAKGSDQKLFICITVGILLFLTFVISWGHGFSRLRLPYLYPMFVVSALGFCYGRSSLHNIFGRKWTKTPVFLVLLLFLGFVCFEKLPVIWPQKAPELTGYYFGPTGSESP